MRIHFKNRPLASAGGEHKVRPYIFAASGKLRLPFREASLSLLVVTTMVMPVGWLSANNQQP